MTQHWNWDAYQQILGDYLRMRAELYEALHQAEERRTEEQRTFAPVEYFILVVIDAYCHLTGESSMCVGDINFLIKYLLLEDTYVPSTASPYILQQIAEEFARS